MKSCLIMYRKEWNLAKLSLLPQTKQNKKQQQNLIICMCSLVHEWHPCIPTKDLEIIPDRSLFFITTPPTFIHTTISFLPSHYLSNSLPFLSVLTASIVFLTVIYFTWSNAIASLRISLPLIFSTHSPHWRQSNFFFYNINLMTSVNSHCLQDKIQL